MKCVFVAFLLLLAVAFAYPSTVLLSGGCQKRHKGLLSRAVAWNKGTLTLSHSESDPKGSLELKFVYGDGRSVVMKGKQIVSVGLTKYDKENDRAQPKEIASSITQITTPSQYCIHVVLHRMIIKNKVRYFCMDQKLQQDKVAALQAIFPPEEDALIAEQGSDEDEVPKDVVEKDLALEQMVPQVEEDEQPEEEVIDEDVEDEGMTVSMTGLKGAASEALSLPAESDAGMEEDSDAEEPVAVEGSNKGVDDLIAKIEELNADIEDAQDEETKAQLEEERNAKLAELNGALTQLLTSMKDNKTFQQAAAKSGPEFNSLYMKLLAELKQNERYRNAAKKTGAELDEPLEDPTAEFERLKQLYERVKRIPGARASVGEAESVEPEVDEPVAEEAEQEEELSPATGNLPSNAMNELQARLALRQKKSEEASVTAPVPSFRRRPHIRRYYY